MDRLSAGTTQDAREVAHDAAARAARDAYGRVVALLAAADGDLQAAQDAVGDALERALRAWPEGGVPDDPAAWLLTVARNRARDRWRSAETRLTGPLDDDVARRLGVVEEVDPDAVGDRRLELMLACAHPDIDRAVRTPLMLDVVLGFTAAQVGRAFVVPGRTMATRLTRAKRRLKAAGVPFEVPDRHALPERMAAVLEAVYGAYVIEWSTGEEPSRLPPEARYLAEIVAELAPTDPEARGLAALVLLSAARAGAGSGPDGEYVPLDQQDPGRWDRSLIERAHEHLRAAHARGVVGRFQLEAAIQAVHCARTPGAATDWPTLRRLHRALDEVAPSLGGTTAYAAVLGTTDGPDAGLAVLERIADRAGGFQPAWVVRAHLLRLAGRTDEAVVAYERAIALTHAPAERRHLQRRLATATTSD
ncbi:RNA polymerase sigma factor [Georgenia sp. Z1491]|uniref:RNA polymerase sigma factor n=1 Tax=Georgenia sp. Z1491 TaxID=3416707 RepID=UPI003CFB3626